MKRKPREVESERLYTVAEVAAYLQLNQHTVYRHIASGRLRSRTLGTRAIRVAQSDLDAYTSAPPEAPRRRQPVGTAIFPEERESVVDLSVWLKQDARMRALKGLAVGSR